VASPGTERPTSARIAWFEQLDSETERNAAASPVEPASPRAVEASAGRGQATLRWHPVDGAIGYLVERADRSDGPFAVIDHGGGDVLAVPAPPYCDTSGEPGRESWYRVRALTEIEDPAGPPSDVVSATPRASGGGQVEINVDARGVVRPLARPWRPVIGSEHLALLLRGRGAGGHDVGEELAEAFRIVHRELGVRSVRAHAILHDSLGVVRRSDGRPTLDLSLVDRVYDRLLETGLTPFVELSFMPHDLASDPDRTTFDYRGIISPPRSLDEWTAVIREFVRHLTERYGLERVATWPFEVWNEPNLQLFWTGTEADYLDLYDATARGVRSVDDRLRVGGPATAAVGWIDDLLAHAADGHVPLDFLTTHTYGAPPLDLRPTAARFGRPDLPIHWTEWGVSPTHASGVNDSVWGAPLVCHGMRSVARRVASLSYWVASDHFVELGEPPRFLHGGFGLLTIGNLRKPRFWALAILERLGDEELPVSCEGDGAGSLVEAWASRQGDGRVGIAVWNGTLDQSKTDGDPLLDRAVRLTIDGLAAGRAEVRHWRVDADHSNVSQTWERLGGGDWPTEDQWRELRRMDRLEELEPVREVGLDRGRLVLEFALPMPAVSLVELTPV
jgi:xylan 1,4-beta-xylosidase